MNGPEPALATWAVDHCLDFLGGSSRAPGLAAHFAGDRRKAAALVSGASRFRSSTQTSTFKMDEGPASVTPDRFQRSAKADAGVSGPVWALLVAPPSSDIDLPAAQFVMGMAALLEGGAVVQLGPPGANVFHHLAVIGRISRAWRAQSAAINALTSACIVDAGNARPSTVSVRSVCSVSC